MTRLRMVTLSALAAAGLLGAHVVDYLLIVPDPLHRHDLLLRTGHGYLKSALAMVIVLAVIALLSHTAVGVRDGGQRRRWFDVVVLGSTQVGAFVALEATERIATGVSADARLWRVLALGVVLQVVVAFVSATILRSADRILAAMRTGGPAPIVRNARPTVAPRPDTTYATLDASQAWSRAPPTLFAA